MSEGKFGYGLVIRADGTVPFDDELHADHKHAMIGHLVAQGHSVKMDEDGAVRIENWTPPTPEAA